MIGATVVVMGSDPILGTTTDVDGRFAINAVPTGRVDLQIRMIGFEEQRMPNLLLTSAKELVLEVRMQESVAQLKEFEVKAPERKGELRNDMATISARKISVEETSRIAGGISDPARMVGTFPGVAGDPSGNNTVVIHPKACSGAWKVWRSPVPITSAMMVAPADRSTC